MGSVSDKKYSKDSSNVYLSLISVGYNFLGAMLLLGFVGYKLDSHFNKNTYYYTIAGLLLGFTWGIYDVFKKVRALEKKQIIQAKLSDKK